MKGFFLIIIFQFIFYPLFSQHYYVDIDAALGNELTVGNEVKLRYKIYSNSTLLEDSGQIVTTAQLIFPKSYREVVYIKPTRINIEYSLYTGTFLGQPIYCTISEDVLINNTDCFLKDMGCDVKLMVYDSNLLTQPGDNTYCHKEIITLSQDFCAPSFSKSINVYQWYYSFDNTTYTKAENVSSFNGGDTQFPIQNFVPNNYIGPLYLKAEINGSNTFSNPIIYNIVGCPPELDNSKTITSSTTCIDNTDGTVTFTFKDDLQAGYDMRFYIYDEAQRLIIENRNLEGDEIVFADAYDNRIISDLSAGNGGYQATITGLTANIDPSQPGNSQDYFVVYQSIQYNGNDVVVKSGEISDTFTVNAPSEVTAGTSNIKQPVCGEDTGSVTVTASGGQDFKNGTYYFSNDDGNNWVTDNSSADPSSYTFEGLEQGLTYIFRTKLVLTDGSGECVSDQDKAESVTINEIQNPLTIDGAEAFSQPTYEGAENGKIRVNISGGNADYRYQIIDESSGLEKEVVNNLFSETIDGLPAGNYTVKVIDGNGCEAVWQETILLVSPPRISITGEELAEPTCSHAEDGSITVTVSGGYLQTNSPGYQYRWAREGDPAFSANTRTISDLSAGIYTVTVTDDNNDFENEFTSDSATYTIEAPAPVEITDVTVTDISCNGAADGEVTVAVTGGTGDYQYKFGNTNEWVNAGGSPFTIPVTQFTYNAELIVTDANGCEYINPERIDVDEPSTLTVEEIQGSHKDNTIYGNADGELEIQVSGGTAPYENFEWTRNGDPFTLLPGSTDTHLVGLEAGSYQVTVTDTNGCTTSLSQAIIIAEPGELLINGATQTDPGCNGDSTGSIEPVVTGGVPPYTYTWTLADGSTEETSQPLITGLPAGTHQVTVTDDSGAEVSASYTLEEPDALGIGFEKADNLCYEGAEGNIDITVTGGTLPYVYSWSNGETTEDIEGLVSGDYTVMVTDGNNCSEELTVTINDPDDPLGITTDEVKQVSAFEASDGAISVTVTGGTAPYTYTWSSDNGFTSDQEDISGLAPGNYTLSVNDGNCSVEEEFTIIEPGELIVTIEETASLLCYGDNNGELYADVQGGISPYSYEWFVVENGTSSGIGQVSASASGLSSGTYTVVITDANGITVTSGPHTLEAPEALGVDILKQDVLCYGEATGSIDISVSGGVAPYVYSWNNGAITEDISGLASGDYTVSITDANNCTYTETITINQPDAPLALEVDEIKQITAFDADDGAISVTVTGGTTPYTYEWFGDNGFESNKEDISGLAPGKYTLVVTDTNDNGSSANCFVEEEFTIVEPGQLIVAIDEVVSLLCHGDDDGELYADVQGGVQPYTYNWFMEVNGTWTEIGQNTSSAYDITAGIYTVTITDANGIEVSSEPHDLEEPEILTITVDEVKDVLCYGEATGAIDIAVTGGVPPYDIIWNNGEDTEDISGLMAGTYEVEIFDSNGCRQQEIIEVKNAYEPLDIATSHVTHVTEYQGTDGEISIDIEGGLPPYDIRWTRLEDQTVVSTLETAVDLIHGQYQVEITDANGCSISATYEVTQPDIIEASITQPTCTGDCDGGISVIVNEGVGDYNYSWDTGETTSTISGLCAGNYTVTVIGYYDEVLVRTYKVKDPEPLFVDLGENTTLCQGQSRLLDATINDPQAAYEWTSGNTFISDQPTITVTQTGTYTVKVTNSSGCTGTGSVGIEKTEEVISAEFFVSSQVYIGERFTAIDVSSPVPDEVTWILPAEAEVVYEDRDQVELYFESEGEYDISMITTLGDCQEIQTKRVLVLEKDESIEEEENNYDGKSRVEDFIVYPNPTRGEFTVKVVMNEVADIRVRVFNLNSNVVVAQDYGRDKEEYSVSFDISNAVSGIYAVVLETPFGNSVRKIIRY